MTNSRLTDPEVLEWRYPVLLESHRINRGSGGRGRHKGGEGTIRRVRFLEPMQAALVSNRREVPPFGLDGGEPGVRGDQWIERAVGGGTEKLPGRCRAEVGAGDVFAIQTPSGGGTAGRKRKSPRVSPRGLRLAAPGRRQLLSWRFSAELLPFLPRTSS